MRSLLPTAVNVLIGAALLLGLPSCFAGSTNPTALAIDDVLAETTVADDGSAIGVSRDGQLLAYTVTPAGRSAELWTIDLRTLTRTNVSEGLLSASTPIWSPDGHFLAFFVTDIEKPAVFNHYEVWVWDRSRSTRRRLTAAIARPLLPGHLLWTADSRFLITDIMQSDASDKALPNDKTPKENQPVGVTVREQQVNLPKALTPGSADMTSGAITQQAPLLFDIARIDVQSGALERIAKGVWPLAYAIAPTGSAVAVVTQDRPGENDDLWVTTAVSGELRKTLVHFTIGRAALAWSPDGKLLAVHSANQSDLKEPNSGAGECYLVELATGKRTKFSVATYDPHYRNIPLWSDQSDAIVLIEGGKIVRHPLASPQSVDSVAVPGGAVESLLHDQLSGRLSDAMVGGRLVAIVSDSNGTSMSVVTVDLATKAAAVLHEGSFYNGYVAALVPENHSVVLGLEDPATPFDLFLFNIATAQSNRLTHLNPQYDRYLFGQIRRTPYRNATAEQRTAVLLLPANYQPGNRYPTIVFERDRANAQFARHFGFWGGAYNMQLYATRGYAVLYPDIWVTRTPKERVTSDVLPAIEAAVETGVVDSNRLALYGHSLGGYHAMMLLVQTGRFKTAIVSQGYYNLLTEFAEHLTPGTMAYAESFVTGTFGPPWQYPYRYIENSPYLQLSRLTTPVLLVGGSRDAFVQQGDQLFAALQHASKPTRYIRYEGEAHNVNSWSLSNRRDYVTRTLAWLDYWLQQEKTNAPSPRAPTE